MRKISLALLSLLSSTTVVGCSSSQLNSPTGQVFCAFQTQGGGQVVAGIATVAGSAAAGPIAAPVIAVGANATQEALTAQCQAAAAAAKATPALANVVGTTGAVPQPLMPVQTVVVPTAP